MIASSVIRVQLYSTKTSSPVKLSDSIMMLLSPTFLQSSNVKFWRSFNAIKMEIIPSSVR